MEYLREMKIYPQLDAITEHVFANKVTFVHAKTGSGKTVAIPRAILEKFQCGEMQGWKLFVSIPTVLNVNLQHQFALLKNPQLKNLYGKACHGKKSNNFHTARVVYATTKTIINYLLKCNQRQTLDKWIIMIDESHHPSEENHILSCLCRWLLHKEIKVIVTTATPSQNYFADHATKPFEVGTTQFPITYHWNDENVIQYSQFQGTQYDRETLLTGLMKRVQEAYSITKGHILVFVSGEMEADEMCRLLAQHYTDCNVYPLYSTLPQDEIELACKPTTVRKIIIATNIAESGVTLDGVNAVVDSCLERKRVLRGDRYILCVSAVSQHSSTQRAGRSGRMSAGHYFPLITSNLYESLPKCIENDFQQTKKHVTIITFLNYGLESRKMLDIPLEEHERCMQELLELKLIDAEHKVTSMGHEFLNYPLPIHATASILRGKDELKEYELFYLVLAVTVCEAVIQTNRVFDVPYEERKSKALYMTSGVFDDFISKTDIEMYVRIFVTCQVDVAGNKCNTWCRKHRINMKFIKTSKRLFDQVWNEACPFLNPTLQDYEELLHSNFSAHTLRILRDIYHDRVYEPVYGNKYMNVKTREMASVDNNSLWLSKMWQECPKQIHSLVDTTIELQNKRSFTILSLCF